MEDITIKQDDEAAKVNTFENVWAALMELRKTVANTSKEVENTSKTAANTSKEVEKMSKEVEKKSKRRRKKSKRLIKLLRICLKTSEAWGIYKAG